MRTFVLEEIGVDQRCNSAAQHLIVFEAPGLEDLEPDFKIRVANENGLILLVAVSRAVQEPALVRVRVFWIKPRIQARNKVPGETIVDPRAVIFAKDDPGLALRIPDDMLPARYRGGRGTASIVTTGSWPSPFRHQTAAEVQDHPQPTEKVMAHHRAPAPSDLLRFCFTEPRTSSGPLRAIGW